MKHKHLTREEGKKLLSKPNRKKSPVQRIRERNSKRQRVVSPAKAKAHGYSRSNS